MDLGVRYILHAHINTFTHTHTCKRTHIHTEIVYRHQNSKTRQYKRIYYNWELRFMSCSFFAIKQTVFSFSLDCLFQKLGGALVETFFWISKSNFISKSSSLVPIRHFLFQFLTSKFQTTKKKDRIHFKILE